MYVSRKKSRKLTGQSMVAAVDFCQTQKCLFVRDQNSNTYFLIDTGADISVILPNNEEKLRPCGKLDLIAANGTPVGTFGMKTISLNLDIRRPITWTIADRNSAIIGVDFYDLLVDVKNKLIDKNTKISSFAAVSNENDPRITMLDCNFAFQNFTIEYIDIMSNSVNTNSQSNSGVHIILKPKIPRSEQECLPIEKLKAGKEEFEKMTQQGIRRPSKSP